MFICSDCIDDPYLELEIRQSGKYAGKCDFCESDKHCMQLEELATRIDEIIQDEYEISSETIARFEEGSDKPYYEPVGLSIDVVIREIIELKHDIISEIISILRRKYDRHVADGGESFYHDGDNIVDTIIFNNPLIYENWDELCYIIKFQQRFFTSNLNELLKSLFSCIKEIPGYCDKLITKIPIGTDLFRARLTNNSNEIFNILKNPSQELGPPPSSLCKSNRLNALGIPVFYCAFDRETSIAEVRPYVGSNVISCIFKLKRELTALNLQEINFGFPDVSHFHPNYKQIFQQRDFLYFLQSEIRKPIAPTDIDMEALPFQLLTEFLAKQFDPKIDAIIYGSAQTKEGKNLVIFTHALGTLNIFPSISQEPKIIVSFPEDSENAMISDYSKLHVPQSLDVEKSTFEYCADSILLSRVNSVKYDTDDRIPILNLE